LVAAGKGLLRDLGDCLFDLVLDLLARGCLEEVVAGTRDTEGSGAVKECVVLGGRSLLGGILAQLLGRKS
jgi:hypothetical protein